MNPIKTLAAAAIAAVISSDVVTAWSGSITFYKDSNFRGSSFKANIWDYTSNTCQTLCDLNNVASSVHWSGIPAKNALGGDNHIAFYTDAACGGTMKRWKSTDNHPSNFQLDGINDQVSSFMVTETYSWADGNYNLPCSASTLGESELLSDATVVDAKANATASHTVN